MTVKELKNLLSQFPDDMDVATMYNLGADVYLRDVTRTEELKAVKMSPISVSRTLDKRGKKVLVLR